MGEYESCARSDEGLSGPGFCFYNGQSENIPTPVS